MPRRPRIHESVASDTGESREARHLWLGRWKRWAVTELPAETPRATRVELRSAVERALARLSPDDDEGEVRDVVAGLVDEARGHLRAAAEAAARAETKREVIAGAGDILAVLLPQFPASAAATMLRRPGYSRLALTERLRRFLDHRLTGAESPERAGEIIVTWVERRLAEQPPPAVSSRLATTVRKAMPLVTAASMVALQHPRVQNEVVRHVTKARNKARMWLDKLIPPQGPPKP